MELLRAANRILSGHGVRHQQDLGRLRSFLIRSSSTIISSSI